MSTKTPKIAQWSLIDLINDCQNEKFLVIILKPEVEVEIPEFFVEDHLLTKDDIEYMSVDDLVTDVSDTYGMNPKKVFGKNKKDDVKMKAGSVALKSYAKQYNKAVNTLDGSEKSFKKLIRSIDKMAGEETARSVLGKTRKVSSKIRILADLYARYKLPDLYS